MTKDETVWYWLARFPSSHGGWGWGSWRSIAVNVVVAYGLMFLALWPGFRWQAAWLSAVAVGVGLGFGLLGAYKRRTKDRGTA